MPGHQRPTLHLQQRLGCVVGERAHAFAPARRQNERFKGHLTGSVGAAKIRGIPDVLSPPAPLAPHLPIVVQPRVEQLRVLRERRRGGGVREDLVRELEQVRAEKQKLEAEARARAEAEKKKAVNEVKKQGKKVLKNLGF